MKEIFPKEIIENTIEVYRFKHSVNSKIIYAFILLTIVIIGISLSYIYLDIYSSARGILNTKKERNQITSLYSGKIKNIYIKENQTVHKGDTLLIVDNAEGIVKLKLLDKQLEQAKTFSHDLKCLINSKILRIDSLHSIFYQKQYLEYVQKLHELKIRLSKATRDFILQKKLYQKSVIAKVKYENSKYNFDLALNGLSYFENQQRNQWQSELTNQNNKFKKLATNLSQDKNIQKNHIITASVNGTIQNVKGLEVGDFIITGKPIGEISPNTNLIAECYVLPSDIGLLKNNSKVKFQIDAFNYNQWGMVTGKVIRINKDITMVNKKPMFKVLCSINQKFLKLKNGFKGKLIKGMTLNARFFIANRSVFELLYDKVDNWFNPSNIKK